MRSRNILDMKKAKSLCYCGHVGDGPDSVHKDRLGGLAPGHGECEVPNCKCRRFEWKRYLTRNEQERFLAGVSA